MTIDQSAFDEVLRPQFQRAALRRRVAELLDFAKGLDSPLAQYHLTRAHVVLGLPADRAALDDQERMRV